MASPYRFGRRQGETQPIGLFGEKLVRELHQDARPVAGRFVGPGRPPVHEIQQHLLAVFHDGMIADARNVDDGADAAGVVLPLRVIKPSCFGGRRHKPIATARRWSQKLFLEGSRSEQRLWPGSVTHAGALILSYH